MNSGALLALAAAVFYGAADFCGGLASRRSSATSVLIVSQLVGLAVLLAILPFAQVRFYADDVPIGVAGGVAAAIGIGLLYAALGIGRMGVVSPITALVSASVPVVVSLASGQRIPTIAAIGCVLAVIAIVAITAGGDGAPAAAGEPHATSWSRFAREPGVVLAFGSGLAIGALYVVLSRGHGDGRLAIVAEMRVVSIPILAVFALVTRRAIVPARGTLGIIALGGVLDMLANAGFVLAARIAPLAIAAVLTSLYPASTVLLAFVVLRERLSYAQVAGVACAGVAVACIAARQ